MSFLQGFQLQSLFSGKQYSIFQGQNKNRWLDGVSLPWQVSFLVLPPRWRREYMWRQRAGGTSGRLTVGGWWGERSLQLERGWRAQAGTHSDHSGSIHSRFQKREVSTQWHRECQGEADRKSKHDHNEPDRKISMSAARKTLSYKLGDVTYSIAITLECHRSRFLKYQSLHLTPLGVNVLYNLYKTDILKIYFKNNKIFCDEMHSVKIRGKWIDLPKTILSIPGIHVSVSIF